jgi:two-component system, LuxR family, sensor kinase FixL
MAAKFSRISEPAAEAAHDDALLGAPALHPMQPDELNSWALAASGVIVWAADEDGQLVSVSPRAHEITGVSEATLRRNGWAAATHPEDTRQAAALWAAALATGEPFRAECRMRCKDGSYRWFLVQAELKPAGDGQRACWYGTLQDIHDRRLGELELRSIEERYRLATNATTEMTWDWNLLSDTVSWNESARGIIDSSTGPLHTSKKWWEERVHPGDRDRVVSSLHDAINGDATQWAAGYRFRKPDRDHAVIADRCFIIRDEQGRAIRAVGAMVDLTERQNAEARLQQAQSELIHISRVSAMSTMASTLAHELNQPLISIANYVRGSRVRLAQAIETPPEVVVALDSAEREVTRAGEIVTHLRKFVSTGKVDAKREDLAILIEEAAGLAFLEISQRRVSHDLELDPSARWAMVDGIQIQQVIINLARNAIDAVQESSRREIVIATRAASPDWIEVTVSDTGPGLPEEIRSTIFTPFQTTKPKGLGLGLSICRTIVEAHGGKIWADAGPDGGTVFTFTLPRPER